MKKIFFFAIFIFNIFVIFSNPQFIGEWNVKYYYVVENEIDLPDLSNYKDLFPRDQEKIDSWEKYVWKEWFEEVEDNLSIVSDLEFENIDIIFNEDGTGVFDGELMVWDFYVSFDEKAEDITHGEIILNFRDDDYLDSANFNFYYDTGVKPAIFTMTIIAFDFDYIDLACFTYIMIAEKLTKEE